MTLLAFYSESQVATSERTDWSANVASFERDIIQLQSSLTIPGVAYTIVQDGEVISKNAFGSIQGDLNESFTTRTALRIASVTKTFTALVILQLMEEGKLQLDDRVNQFIPAQSVNNRLPKEATIKHLLTHTSENLLGQTFVYATNRYGLLAQVIETIEKKTFEQSVNERIFRPAGMDGFDSPQLGGQAGLVTNVEQMAKYLSAIQTHKIISVSSGQRLLEPSQTTKGDILPTSLGWFTQTIQGQRLIWSFGQDEPRHSGALLLTLPEKNLSVFILANANTISDPFRLMMGDVSKSPFALSFLRLFAFSKPGNPMAVKIGLFSHAFSDQKLAIDGYDFNDELFAGALVDIWNRDIENARDKINSYIFRASPVELVDPVFHYVAVRLPDIGLKQRAVKAGEKLLEKYSDNRWILLTQGYLLQQLGQNEKSADLFRRILNLENQHPDYLRRLFKIWCWQALAEIEQFDQPDIAKSYLQAILQSGVEDQEKQAAEKLLASMAQRMLNREKEQ